VFKRCPIGQTTLGRLRKLAKGRAFRKKPSIVGKSAAAHCGIHLDARSATLSARSLPLGNTVQRNVKIAKEVGLNFVFRWGRAQRAGKPSFNFSTVTFFQPLAGIDSECYNTSEFFGFRTQPLLPHRLAPNSVCRWFRHAEHPFGNQIISITEDSIDTGIKR